MIFVFSVSCTPNEYPPQLPTAENGVLDLRGWDFKKDGPVKLDGKWQFYWKQLLFYKDFTKINPPVPLGSYLIPQYWNQHNVKGETLPGKGYATYRLKVLLDEPMLMAFKFRTIYSAFLMEVNGSIVTRVGKVGTDQSNYVAKIRPHVAHYNVTQNELDILLQVSNYSIIYSGVLESIYFGSLPHIIQLEEDKLSTDLLLMGSIFIMSLYHFGLFLLRRSDRSPLFFAGICLIFCIALGGLNEFVFTRFFLELDFETHFKIVLIFTYLIEYVFLAYLYSLYPNEVSVKFIRFLLYSGLFLYGVTLLTSVYFSSVMAIYWTPIIFMWIFYCIYCVILAVYRKREGARVLMFGVVILCMTGIHDILHVNQYIQSKLGSIMSMGLFIFVFSQAFLLSQRFSKSFKRSEKLSSELTERSLELKSSRDNLEVMVEQRTQELQESNHALSETNRNIYDSLIYASIMQRALLPLEERLNQLFKDHFVIWEPRDIVGGDIYFCFPTSKGCLLAVIDCTGHGVPGAFLTTIAGSSFESMIQHEYFNDPSRFLQALNEFVQQTLQQGDQNAKSDNGMDVGVCCIDQQSNKIIFAGAKISLLIADENSLKEIRGDKHSIGYNSLNHHYEYSNHFIKSSSTATYYMYTDGFPDQTGGKKGFSFGNKKVRELLSKNHQLSLLQQKYLIVKTMDDYQEDQPRKDDVTVFGFRL